LGLVIETIRPFAEGACGVGIAGLGFLEQGEAAQRSCGFPFRVRRKCFDGLAQAFFGRFRLSFLDQGFRGFDKEGGIRFVTLWLSRLRLVKQTGRTCAGFRIAAGGDGKSMCKIPILREFENRFFQ